MSTATWQTENSGSRTVRIGNGTDGLATVTGKNDWVLRHFLHDALGSVIALVDIPEGSGEPQVTEVFQYDGWGNPLWLTAIEPLGNGLPGPSLPTAYLWNGASGCYFDEDVGMYLMGLRWYEPYTGRFLTRDPIGFGGRDANLYRYVWNNPVNGLDVWGLDEDLLRRAGKAGRKNIEITDADLDAQFERIYHRIRADMPSPLFEHFAWRNFMWGSGRMDTDFRFHSEDTYVYVGTKYPGLKGKIFSGGELNYIGVGAGLGASGFSLGDRVFGIDWVVRKYKAGAYGTTPSPNTLTAANVGYMAYWWAHRRPSPPSNMTHSEMEEIYLQPIVVEEPYRHIVYR